MSISDLNFLEVICLQKQQGTNFFGPIGELICENCISFYVILNIDLVCELTEYPEYLSTFTFDEKRPLFISREMKPCQSYRIVLIQTISEASKNMHFRDSKGMMYLPELKSALNLRYPPSPPSN